MAKWSLVGDEAVEGHFRRAGDGWIFCAQGWSVPDGRGVLSPPWSKVNFIVSDAQKAALDPILRRAAGFYSKAIFIAMLVSAALFGLGVLALHLTQLPQNVLQLAFALSWAILTLTLFPLIAARRIRGFQRDLGAVLANAQTTDQRVNFADRIARQGTSISFGKLLWGVAVLAISLTFNVREVVHALPMKSGASVADWGMLALNLFGIVTFVVFLAGSAVMMVARLKAWRTSAS